MAVYLYDSFTGTPGTVFAGHVGEVGANWAIGGSLNNSIFKFDATGQRIRSANANSNSMYYSTSSQAQADGGYCELEYYMGTAAAGSFGAVARAAARRGYIAQYNQNGTIIVARMDISGGNTATVNLNFDDGAASKSAPHVLNTLHKLRITVTGTGATVTVQVHLDGNLIGTVSDTSANRVTTFGSVAFAGFGDFSETTGAHFTSIRGGAPAATATTYSITGPSTAAANMESLEFVSIANGDTTAMITVSDGADGVFSPSATFKADGGTFTYTPKSSGTKTLTFTNNGALTNPSARTVSATAQPSGTITNQPSPDGQNQRFIGTTTDASSGTYTLAPSDGGSNVGPFSFTVTNNAFDFTVTALRPATWTPTLTVQGEGGFASVSGTSSFTIAGVGGVGEVPKVKSVSISLKNINATSVGSISGLKWAWFDQTTPDMLLAPTDKGSGVSTDSNGVFTVNLINSAKNIGDIGWLIVTSSDGTPSTQYKAFSGPVAVA